MQAPSQTPQTVHVSPSTCHDLSLFKGAEYMHIAHPHDSRTYPTIYTLELLKEYRRLDDLITMRINRANAHQRDKDRLDPVRGNLQDEACSQVWKELIGAHSSFISTSRGTINAQTCIANWSRRTKLVEYCVSVVDTSMEEKKRTIAGLETDDARRKAQVQLFAEEVKVSR